MAGVAKSMQPMAEHWRRFVDPDTGAVYADVENDATYRRMVASEARIVEDLVGLEGDRRATLLQLAVKDLHRAVSWGGMWSHYGFNCIDLSPSMVAALLMTDASSLDVSEIRLPWPAVLLLIPPGFVGAKTRILLQSRRLLRGRGTLRALPLPSLEGQETTQVIEYMAFAESDGRADMITDQIADYRAAQGGFGAWMSQAPAPAAEEWKVPLDAMSDVLRATKSCSSLVTSMLAYLCATGDMVASRRGGRSKKSNDRTRPAFWEIGRGVRLAPAAVRAVKESASGSRAAVKVAERHIVRGHYKRQPCGPGGRDRKTVWVAPYWRGPDGDAAWAHVYRM